MRTIELSSWESVPLKADSLRRSLEIIYGVKLGTDSSEIQLDRLYPTEDFLENDKIALVFMKIVNEGYDAPIIAVERGEDYFVLDGHHRCFISKKLEKKTIMAKVLKFPEGTGYRDAPKSSLEDLLIKEVAVINDLIVKAWGRILNIMKQYEVLYHMHFHMKKEQIRLKDLSPTQPEVLKEQIDAINRLLVPIACIEYGKRYYVLDGHARCLRAKQLGLKSIQAIVLLPQVQVDFGIVKTAKEMKLESLEDVIITK
ncbi:MAG: ParB N-terminal domain-containing protein [Candidatus Bathyarchaeia archaeon]